MKRLCENLQLPSGLRTDLARSRAAGRHYNALDKLLQLRAALVASVPGATPAADGGVGP